MSSSSSTSPKSFPPDLIFSIFSKLPAKSLLRFRLLSKSCSDLITSRPFAAVHHPLLRPKPGLLITCPTKLQSAQSFYVTDLSGGTASLRLTIPPRFSRYTTQSANGIVCIDFGITATIVNPTTSDFLPLPFLCPKNSPAASSTYFCVNFFGFDPINNEYKVLNSWGNYIMGRVEYRALTLGSNQWRILSYGGPPVYAQRECLCFAGIIFFRGWIRGVGSVNRNSNVNGIRIARLVCFHVSSESFRVINLPNGAPCNTESSCLVQIKGVIAIVDYRIVEEDYCVWVLRDFEKEMWERHWIAKPHCLKSLYCGHRFVVVGSTETGEIVIVLSCLSSTFCVIYLDVLKGGFRRVMVTGLPKYDSFDLSSNLVYVTNYVENILPLH